MNYLSGLLKGEAAKVIQGLPLSESNYKRVVDLLKERFGQKQVLINAHMDALLKIPVATNDVKKLRSLYDGCEGYIHGLESLDVYPESYGVILKSYCTGYVLRNFQIRLCQGGSRKLTNQHKWKFCISTSNPADLLSRGVAIGALVDECSIWWKGPHWLCESADKWPVWMSSSNHVVQEIHLESMKAVCMATGEPSSSLLNVIDLERYSSLKRLLAVTSRVIRFLTNCKSGEKDRKSGPFTTQELSIAMTLWIKGVQGQAFSREIQQLSRKDTKLFLPLIRQLHLYLDDNAVLRCRGRLESAPLDDQSKFPVLLPKNEHFTSFGCFSCTRTSTSRWGQGNTHATQREVLDTSWTSVG